MLGAFAGSTVRHQRQQPARGSQAPRRTPIRSCPTAALQAKYAAALEAAPEGAAQQRAVYHGNRAACHAKREQWAEVAQVGPSDSLP